MMTNQPTNESGYALVTVLLIIVVFMVISLSFMGQSFNSVKQNKTVETDYQSVALAEMGVEYLEAEVKNVLEVNRSEIVRSILQEVEKERRGDPRKDYSQVAVEQLKIVIDKELDQSRNMLIDNSRPDVFFEVTRSSSLPDGGVLTIPYTSNGVKEGHTSQLTGEIIVPIVFKSVISTEGELEPRFNKIIRPEEGPGVCVNPYTIPDDCEQLLLTKDMKYSKGVKNLELIYTDKGVVLTIDEVMNHAKRMSIHAEGIVKFNKNMKHINNLTMEVNGKLEFDDHLNVTDSSIYIKGPLTIDKHLSLSGNSILYVLGDLDLNGKLDVASDSKVCVRGNLSVGKKDDSVGKVYYTGTYTGEKSKGSNSGNAEKLDISTFENECNEVDVYWGKIDKTVKY